MNAADVRVVQGGQHLRLALEPRQPLGVGGEHRRQDLESHLAPQPRVARAIHLAHAPGAQRPGDFIRTDVRADGQRHVDVRS